MAFVIEDGTGTGRKTGVNKENRLEVAALTIPQDQAINEERGEVWSIPFEGLNPTAGDDYVLYIKNTGDATLQVSDVRIMADNTATQVEIHAVTGTAGGSLSDIAAVSRTVGSAATPEADIKSSVDITGLTGSGVLFFIQCDTVNREYHLRTSSKIRIPKGKAIAILVETATANVTGVVSLIKEEKNSD